MPVLRIARADAPDEWMGESADIIRYLDERFGDGHRVRRRLARRRWLGGALARGRRRSASDGPSEAA